MKLSPTFSILVLLALVAFSGFFINQAAQEVDASTSASVILAVAPKPVNGVCGNTSAAATMAEVRSRNLCAKGDLVADTLRSTDTSFAWRCSGQNGGNAIGCIVPRILPTAPTPPAVPAITNTILNLSGSSAVSSQSLPFVGPTQATTTKPSSNSLLNLFTTPASSSHPVNIIQNLLNPPHATTTLILSNPFNVHVVPGCGLGARFSATTGAACSDATSTGPVGCALNTVFSPVTGERCPAQATSTPRTTSTTASIAAITITSPIEGQVLVNKSDANSKPTMGTVTWTSTGLTSDRTLVAALYDKNGLVERIDEDVTNDGSYTWKADQKLPNGTYRIALVTKNGTKVTGYSGWFLLSPVAVSTIVPITDPTQASTALDSAHTITVSNPNKQTVIVNPKKDGVTLLTIRWNSDKSLGKDRNLTINLQDNVSRVSTIVSNVPNNGSYVWKSTQGLQNGTYRVQIITTDDNHSYRGTSDYFKIVQK